MSFDVTEFLTATQQEQEAYRDERQAERKALIEQQDKGIMEYTNDPEQYAVYLDRQARNLRYSPGNTALIMQERPEADVVLSMKEWGKLGRTVQDAERAHGIRILRPKDYKGTRKTDRISEEGEYFEAGETYSGTGFQVQMVYDLTQTTGLAYTPPSLIGQDPEQRAVLLRNLQHGCPVPIKLSDTIPDAARYDPQTHTLYIRPDLDESQFFLAFAAESVQATLHNHGQNWDYRHEDFEADAASIGYMLCRRYGIAAERSEALSGVTGVFAACPVEDRREMLDANRDLARSMAERLEWGLNRQTEKGRRTAPTRRQGAR